MHSLRPPTNKLERINMNLNLDSPESSLTLKIKLLSLYARMCLSRVLVEMRANRQKKAKVEPSHPREHISA